MKNMKLGICIDGVVRNKFGQFESLYRKKYIFNPGLVHMNEDYEFVDRDSSAEEDKALELLEQEKIHLPISTYDLTNHFEFDSTEEYNKFIQDYYAFELNATAPCFPKAMDVVNRIQYMCEEKNMFDIYIISPGKEQSVSATLHFLTKNVCRIKNISFREYTKELWNDFDVLITDCPEILDNKPEGKFSVKINQDYNINCKSDLDFQFLYHMYSDETMNKIFTSFKK